MVLRLPVPSIAALLLLAAGAAQAQPAPGCPPTTQPQPSHPLMHALEHRAAGARHQPLSRQARPGAHLTAATPEIRYAVRCGAAKLPKPQA